MKILTVFLIFITFSIFGDITYTIDDDDIGNIIKAKVNGKEIELTTREEMKCYSLNKVLDFNNDTYEDALITHQVACGGNGSPNEFFFITYNKKEGFTKTEVFATSWEIPNIGMLDDKITVSLKPFILNKNLDQIKEKYFSLDSTGKVSPVINHKKISPIKKPEKKTKQIEKPTPKEPTPQTKVTTLESFEIAKQELDTTPPKNSKVIKAEKAEPIKSASGSISLVLLASALGLLGWKFRNIM